MITMQAAANRRLGAASVMALAQEFNNYGQLVAEFDGSVNTHGDRVTFAIDVEVGHARPPGVRDTPLPDDDIAHGTSTTGQVYINDSCVTGTAARGEIDPEDHCTTHRPS